MNKAAEETFNGVMLSDGSIRARPWREAQFRIDLAGTAHKDWLESIAVALEKMNYVQIRGVLSLF